MKFQVSLHIPYYCIIDILMPLELKVLMSTVLSVWSGTQSYNVEIVARCLEKMVVGLGNSPSFGRGIVKEELQGIIPVYCRYEFGQDRVATSPVMAICVVSFSQDG